MADQAPPEGPVTNPDARRGTPGRDLTKKDVVTKRDLVGDTEPLTFRIPKAWKRVLKNMLAATEERAFAASQPELAGPWNESVIARKIFFRGYRAEVEEHAVRWLRNGVPLQHVCELTELDEGYLALLARQHKVEVNTQATWPPRPPASSGVTAPESSPSQVPAKATAEQIAQLDRILVS